MERIHNTNRLLFLLLIVLFSCVTWSFAKENALGNKISAPKAANDEVTEEKGDAKADESSEADSTLILLIICLLIVSVLTIWLFKVRRFRFVHESGLCMLYGMLVGLIIKYSGGVNRPPGTMVSLPHNLTSIPDNLWLRFGSKKYSYSLKGPLYTTSKDGGDELENKAVFDPNVFFYALLPPIIFYAGYDMKKRFFFRNLGAVLTYAFIGTTISCLVFGGLIYGFVQMVGAQHYPGFTFHESLIFGSFVSATDPVTVLAIFHDLHVDVDLFALVFGESVMNDAVAIVLYGSVKHYQLEVFNTISFFKAIGEFAGVFAGSFFLGSAMGLATALVTKLTYLGQFPKLETALFCLMSYSTFLIAEVAGLTGIVAVLFCGISQAHYTFNNLSDESKVATKEIFGLLNFLSENFIFVYMGLTIFTFQSHLHWDPGFIAWAFLAVAISRAANIYPLSFLLNLKRTKKIPMNFQHMLFFAGLRGAVAFALAIRNTADLARQLMLTTVLVIVIATVLFNGGLTTQALMYLKIRVNVDPDEDITIEQVQDASGDVHEDISYERSWLVTQWHKFDVRVMKPMFTNKGGSVYDLLPVCCDPVSRCLTSPERRQQEYEETKKEKTEYG